MLVTLSGDIINYLVTPASIHDSKACEELVEDTHFLVILADLGYLSQSLKQRLSQKGYHLWTPLRQNISGANHHNNWKLMAKRRTIETRFSVLSTEFDIQRPLKILTSISFLSFLSTHRLLRRKIKCLKNYINQGCLAFLFCNFTTASVLAVCGNISTD